MTHRSNHNGKHRPVGGDLHNDCKRRGNVMNNQGSLPRHLFLISAAIALIVPFLARLPNVPLRGWDWFTDYLHGLDGILFFSGINLIPAFALYGLGKLSSRALLPYWLALAALIAFLLWAHGTMNLSGSSTAVLGLLFIPIYAAGAAVVGWILGCFTHAIVRDERGRVWMAGIAITIAIAGGITASVYESASIVTREARFPFVAVKVAPLIKREVYLCCPVGRIEVLALDNFDTKPGSDIAVLGATGFAVLDPATYAVKSRTPFNHPDCEGHFRMHPYLVPSGKGGLLVATSAGLSDSCGRLLWGTKADGFSKTIPIRAKRGTVNFLAAHKDNRIDYHGIDGKVLWSINLSVSDICAYVDDDCQELPSAVTGYRGSRQLRVYDAAGKEIRIIPLPEWGSTVQAIAWPRPGHVLVGGRSWIDVLDHDGREVLKHVIQDTSFDPYHGPNGAAVRFRATEGPYLAVASHGSSGYPRSVLLVFDPKGNLVWQEEMKKIRSILAVPNPAGSGEALLVGGMDGVVEYTLHHTLAPGPTASSDARKNGVNDREH